MDLKQMRPHIIAIVAFLAITLAYFAPVIKGKRLAQHDVVQSHAMAKEAIDYHEKTGDYALWTGRMFSGMPVIQIWMGTKTNIFRETWVVVRSFFVSPIDVVLLYLLGFYLFLSILGFSPVFAALGSIGFAFSSYNFIIIEAGHLAKVMALAYAAPILGGIYLILKEKYLKGLVLTSIAVGLEIHANHIQITYYLFFVIVIWMLFELYDAFKNGSFNKYLKAVGVMALGAVLGVLPNTTPLLTTKDYAEETIRGAQELTSKKIDGNGLDKDYALSWSYGKLETFTLFIPNFMGGASGGSLDTDSESYQELLRQGVQKKQATGFLTSLPLYWGSQPFTSGPVYFGAIIILLALMGFLLSNDRNRWWLLAATLFCLFISWGKNMDWFYSIFFDYFPLFNKFRSPSMMLAVANVTTIWLAMIGVKAIVDTKKQDIKKVLQIGGSFAGLCLVMALMGGAIFDFTSQSEKNGQTGDDQFEQQLVQMTKNKDFASGLVASIKEDRATMMKNDAWRSVLFLILALGLIYFFIKGKIKEQYLGIALAALVLIDLWGVDKRYLNEADFVKTKDVAKNFSLSPAETQMLQDPDPHYRVLNTTVNIFNDAGPSYYYKTIGGYNAAKLKRYQDLIERHIGPEIQQLNNGFEGVNVLNMLNMKYVIFGTEANKVALNDQALGNAWFVNRIIEVENADSEIAALNEFNPREEAVIDRRFSDIYKSHEFKRDAAATIELKSYDPMVLTYDFNSSQDEMVIFSEIFYKGNKDWVSYIDGEVVPHFRANYVLRGMVVPKGKHLIEFKFEPKIYALSEKISLAGSILIVLLVISFIVITFKNKKEEVIKE
ncbi:MAG: hypothetical protein KDC83_05690 [Flavobacteriales bacterium]|nr:hypothetical protein [Flavobacteriales bacterium]